MEHMEKAETVSRCMAMVLQRTGSSLSTTGNSTLRGMATTVEIISSSAKLLGMLRGELWWTGINREQVQVVHGEIGQLQIGTKIRPSHVATMSMIKSRISSASASLRTAWKGVAAANGVVASRHNQWTPTYKFPTSPECLYSMWLAGRIVAAVWIIVLTLEGLICGEPCTPIGAAAKRLMVLTLVPAMRLMTLETLRYVRQ
mmetsp:Transcript_22823/g.44356  ORF Transcript_22823/g.44356 Transcript_22823/m.44356 type:complete len:201 (+) Transcript_22823:1573-2175(+)